MQEMKYNHVFFAERNIRGAWVVYGNISVRQYYGYTKSEAIKKYQEEAEKILFEVKK